MCVAATDSNEIADYVNLRIKLFKLCNESFLDF